MKVKAPGKAHREGLTIVQIVEMFPDEKTATEWFEEEVWQGERCCGHCGSVNTKETPRRKPMPYWCRDCRKYFSVRTGTAIAHSNVPLRKWAIAIYLCLTSLKSISSMKLHRDIGVTQKTAWFMLHRIREAWAHEMECEFRGPVEADECYMGGKRRNMSNKKRKALAGTGRGSVGKTAVAGIKDRESNRVSAKVVRKVDGETMGRFILDHTKPGARIYTDAALTYNRLPNHDSVRHSHSEFVRGDTHTNGVESFWSMLKRAHKGTFHKISPKHLDRYVREFSGKHNLRESGTLDQMRATVAGLVGRSLLYRRLTADNGLPSGARS